MTFNLALSSLSASAAVPSAHLHEISFAALPKSVALLGTMPRYLLIALACVAVAALIVVLPWWLAHRKPRERQISRHSVHRAPERWREQVSDVVERFHSHDLDEADAYAELARICREFASVRLGTDFTSKTLLDLNAHHQVGGKVHFESLKRTISALYPAEFADASTNAQARESSVETAADWVDSMIERWVA